MAPPQELKDADPWATGWRKRLKTQLTVPKVGRTGGAYMRR